MYVCMHIVMYIYIYIYIHVHTIHIYIYIYIYIHCMLLVYMAGLRLVRGPGHDQTLLRVPRAALLV